MKNDIPTLASELVGVAGIISTIAIAFEDSNSRPTPEVMQDACFGLAGYISRIANDLEEHTAE